MFPDGVPSRYFPKLSTRTQVKDGILYYEAKIIFISTGSTIVTVNHITVY